MKRYLVAKKTGIVLASLLFFSAFTALGSLVFANESGESSVVLNDKVGSFSIAQPYTVTEEVTYVDVIQVLVEWQVKDAASQGTKSKWNVETLTWDVNSSSDEQGKEVNLDNSNMCTQVRITNRSSLPVEAKISTIENIADLSDVRLTKINGDEDKDIALDSWFEIGSVVNSDHSVDLSNEHEADIAISMTSDLKNADSGLFTVTIRCLEK